MVLERTKAIELPLSICYRCPKAHIELVRRLYPQIPIEAKTDAEEGTITHLDENELDQHLKVGDMVISRKTASLVSMCINLISKGIALNFYPPCYVNPRVNLYQILLEDKVDFL